ncbi:MAG: hypothetical protein GVY27_09065 [Deinococcus-Thermus bacterium]|jgi:hypothetical protein|nr:hypothetical protein [Deinococcota bacterium]
MMTLALSAAATAGAQDAGRTEARQAAQEAYQTHRRQHADPDHVMARPGLIADRQARTVRLWAATTDVARNEPAEFFVITDDSAKDYEALAVAFVEGADLVQAMSFIGMAPGEPVNYDALRAWPKGERVTMTMHWTDGDGKPQNAPIESLVYDHGRERTLVPAGLIYTGSYWLKADANHPRRLAVDTYDAGSIASTYNEPTTLFDVPRRARQGAVYERFTPSDVFASIGAWKPVELVIKPQRTQGPPRVYDLTLQATVTDPGAAPDDLAAVRVKLVDADGRTVGQPGRLDAALETLADAAAKRDPYVAVKFGADVPLGLVRRLCRMLQAAESPQGIRIEPPPEGQLYFRAFLPPEKLRDRSERLFHAWELQVTPGDDRPRLRLIETYDQRTDGGEFRTAKRVSQPEDGEALARKLVAVDEDRPREVFVHAPATMRYGPLMRVLRPALPTHNVIHVYLNQQP